MVNTAKAFERYREQEVSTANPVGLVVMLYNGCIKRLKLAQLSIDKKNFSDTNAHLKRAQDIISELVSSLDLKYQVAKDLLSLYDFMLRQIVSINFSKNSDDIEPLVEMLTGLRDTWVQVGKNCGTAYEAEGLER